MNRGLRNELMFLGLLGSLGAWFLGKRKLATSFAVGSAGLFASSLVEKKETFFGKNILITGGSRGLGLALAKELILGGASVSLLARDFAELERAKDILLPLKTNQNHLSRVLLYQCDVTDQKQLHEAIKNTLADLGSIDVLINNAGVITVGPFDSMEEEDFRAQMELHLFAVINPVKLVLPEFRKKGGGKIINICSLGGKVAVPHMLPYDTSKFALAGFSQGITAELAKDNIQILTVYPTTMRTGSPIQAVFKGDTEKEFTWFAIGDYMPGLSLPAYVAAKKILKASLEGRTELVPTFWGQARIAGSVFFPELMNLSFEWMNSLLPKDTSRVHKTGAESRGLFDKTAVLKPLREIAKGDEKELNQIEKFDSRFNAGLLH